jgi:hypothetical protein
VRLMRSGRCKPKRLVFEAFGKEVVTTTGYFPFYV